jgi:hypothetical protein
LEAGTLRNICILEIRSCEKSSFAGQTREADPFTFWGRPMMPWKKQVKAHGVPPGNGIDSLTAKASQPAGSESCMWRWQHRS